MQKKPADWNLDRILFSECNVADCDPHERNQGWCDWETPFRLSRWISFGNNFLEILDNQNFNARIKISGFSIESSSTGVIFSIENLPEEIKHAVLEIYKIEYGQKSINFRFSGVAGPWCKKKPADWILGRILFSKCNVADCDPHEGNQSCSYWDKPFWLRRWISFSNYFLENLGYQVFVARNKINGF